MIETGPISGITSIDRVGDYHEATVLGVHFKHELDSVQRSGRLHLISCTPDSQGVYHPYQREEFGLYNQSQRAEAIRLGENPDFKTVFSRIGCPAVRRCISCPLNKS